MLRTQRKPKLGEQGFTLVEVLIAILIIVLFVGVAMQGMMVAVIFKAKAQEYAEATTWIQEDLETVKYIASKFQFPQATLAANATAGSSSISVNAPNINIFNSFATNDSLQVGLDSTSYKIIAVNGAGLARTLSITPNLVIDQVQNAAVVATKMCNPEGANPQLAGLADGLRDDILAAENTAANSNTSNYIDSTKNFRIRKRFSRRRTTTLSTDIPYNVLQVKYEVSPGDAFDSSKIIAEFDTEVIPDVAFQCP